MSDAVLETAGVSKKFCRNLKRSLWYGLRDLAAEMLLRRRQCETLRRDEFWALQDISLKLRRGETLGLIGHNGAGKSTLLKVINGLIRPDAGKVTVRGRVGALIELGAGFNPILTGRENIFVNAAVLGIPRRETKRRLQEIIDFAEIGDFIDAPLQTYSSGMKVRLGFSVATHLDPDLLLVDEVLSVGDASFRQRCLERMGEYRKKGGAIVFISHNTLAVEQLCDRVVLLERGRIAADGNSEETVAAYEESSLRLSLAADQRLHAGDDHGAEGKGAGAGAVVRIDKVEVLNRNCGPTEEIDFGDDFRVRVHFVINGNAEDSYFVIGFCKGSRGEPLFCQVTNLWDGVSLAGSLQKGCTECLFRSPPFTPGAYFVHVGVLANASGKLGVKWLAPPRCAVSFIVKPGTIRECLPGIPEAQLVDRMPPLFVDHSWPAAGES